MHRKIFMFIILVIALVFMGCDDLWSKKSNKSNKSSKSPSTIVFADGETVTRMISRGTYFNTVSGTGEGIVTYTSGTPETATVDQTSGLVTLVALGTTVITANKKATATHKATTRTYTLNVIVSTPSTIVFADGAAVSKILGSGTYTNTISGDGTGAVTYSSGTTAKATVDSDSGAVTLLAAGSTVVTASKAATDTHEALTKTYTLTIIDIGSEYQGGKLAYILQYGDPGYDAATEHGLIAASADHTTFLIWASPANQTTSVITGSALGTGQANTTAIVTQNGTGDTYAARICDEFTNTDTGTGVYSDWYLPSKDELAKLYINRTKIGGFNGDLYWSSTQYNASVAYSYDFVGKTSTETLKSGPNDIRAVRSF